MVKKNIRVAVLLGGVSSEREVSRRTGRMVMRFLPTRFRAKAYDPAKDLSRLVRDCQGKKIDVAFNALHGKGGEDGSIQGLLDLLGIPYTGSGVLASALAMDKDAAKRLFTVARIPTPPWILVTRDSWKTSRRKLLTTIRRRLGTRVVVKPNRSGSSVGMTVKPSQRELPRAIMKALREDGSACLVEPLIKGRELTVGVLGVAKPQALPVIEIRTRRKFFDYRAKYDDATTQEIVPAPIPPRIARRAQALAIACHIALGCRGYSRTDMIWHGRGIDVLEINTLPGLTSASLLPKAAQAAGIEFTSLLERLIAYALATRHD